MPEMDALCDSHRSCTENEQIIQLILLVIVHNYFDCSISQNLKQEQSNIRKTMHQ